MIQALGLRGQGSWVSLHALGTGIKECDPYIIPHRIVPLFATGPLVTSRLGSLGVRFGSGS